MRGYSLLKYQSKIVYIVSLSHAGDLSFILLLDILFQQSFQELRNEAALNASTDNIHPLCRRLLDFLDRPVHYFILVRSLPG